MKESHRFIFEQPALEHIVVCEVSGFKLHTHTYTHVKKVKDCNGNREREGKDDSKQNECGLETKWHLLYKDFTCRNSRKRISRTLFYFGIVVAVVFTEVI